MDLFLNLLKYSQKFPKLYFCEILELRSLENIQKINKWLSFCDKASLSTKDSFVFSADNTFFSLNSNQGPSFRSIHTKVQS
jgi:hypothetical protein